MQFDIWSIFTIFKLNKNFVNPTFIRATQFLLFVLSGFLISLVWLILLLSSSCLALLSSRSFPLVWLFFLLSSFSLATHSAQVLLFDLPCCSIPPVLPFFPFSFSGLTILTALLLLLDLSCCSVPLVWYLLLLSSSGDDYHYLCYSVIVKTSNMLMDVEHSQKLDELYLADLSICVVVHYISIGQLLVILKQA